MRGYMMRFPEERNNVLRAPVIQPSRDHTESVPMHPEDYKAHLAWITAKRFHELVLKETFPEKSKYFHRIG